MTHHRTAGAIAALALSVAALIGTAASADASSAAGKWKNCTAYNKVYKHGVGKTHAHDHVRGGTRPVTNFKHSTKLYKTAMAHNKRLDRDKDGVACEKR